MYKFTIEYCFERFHTGEFNYNCTRTGVVFAKSRNEAIKKLCEVDDDYGCSKHITFEEVEEGAE